MYHSPKMTRAIDCEHHLTIHLMNHITSASESTHEKVLDIILDFIVAWNSVALLQTKEQEMQF